MRQAPGPWFTGWRIAAECVAQVDSGRSDGGSSPPVAADSTATSAASSSGVASPRTTIAGAFVGVVLVVGHSGMLPCFLGGSDARLVRSARRALVTFIRVFDGVITVSM